MYTTYLASIFRSIRFGLNEAHGRGVAIQLNYFLDHGGVTVSPDGTFGVDRAPHQAERDRSHARHHDDAGDGLYAEAKQMIDTMAVMRPPIQRVLDRLTAIPIDIAPRFVTADALGR